MSNLSWIRIPNLYNRIQDLYNRIQDLYNRIQDSNSEQNDLEENLNSYNAHKIGFTCGFITLNKLKSHIADRKKIVPGTINCFIVYNF